MTEIFGISKDPRRAKALRELAKKRYSTISTLKEPFRILEEYYEIIKELLTAFMYSSGFKTLSHKALVEFAKRNIKILTSLEISLIDELRIKRNNIVYYGEDVTLEFIKKREPSVKEIISKLFNLQN
jgi:hypothetical protein